jgi:hypothetical protein
MGMEIKKRCAVFYHLLVHVTSHFHASSPPSALAFFFLLFLFSRRFLARSALNSSSLSSSLSVLTSSGLYQTGGCVISVGPAGKSAIVKWKPATKVWGAVYLETPVSA